MLNIYFTYNFNLVNLLKKSKISMRFKTQDTNGEKIKSQL